MIVLSRQELVQLTDCVPTEKVDIRLIPMLALLYLAAHIDRANIGNAKIEGMIEDLGMTGVQYNTVLSICEHYPSTRAPGP